MQSKSLDLSTILGVALAAFMIIIGIKVNGDLAVFFDISALIIVIFGTFSITTASFSLEEVILAHYYIFQMILWKIERPQRAAIKCLEFAAFARNSEPQKIELELKRTNYGKLLTKGVNMVIDGVIREEIEKIISQDIMSVTEQQSRVISILRKSAEIAPAMGLIGTIIGLVQMLGSLDDVSKIGPAMSTALITTFYGAILSYVVFSPVAWKLERNIKEELLISKIYLKAILSIAKKENPRFLENEINSILSPANRVRFFKDRE